MIKSIRFNKTILLFLFCTITLFLGFQENSWKASEWEWFDYFQLEMESAVVGRLAKAEHDGIFSQGGLTGWYYTKEETDPAHQFRFLPTGQRQYDIYENRLEPENLSFVTYDSQSGGQALTFALLDKISPFSDSINIKLFRSITSLFTAIVFSIFITWLFQNFGLGCSLIVLILMLYSQWLTVFGKNLWWSLWAFYIPFVTVLMLLSLESKNLLSFNKISYLLICFGVFIKCFYTGFEYISTTLIMVHGPIVFYAALGRWELKKIIKRMLVSSLASIAAILMAMFVLAYQLSFVKGSLSEGFRHIFLRFLKRTHGNANGMPKDWFAKEIYLKESLEVSIPNVLKEYWNGIAFDFNHLIGTTSGEDFYRIEFGSLILTFIIFSGLVFVTHKLLPITASLRQKNIALVAACWYSILGPLSWFIVFKAHSYLHTHMNFITWYFPFALFGFGLIGSITISLTKDLYLRLKNFTSS